MEARLEYWSVGLSLVYTYPPSDHFNASCLSPGVSRGYPEYEYGASSLNPASDRYTYRLHDPQWTNRASAGRKRVYCAVCGRRERVWCVEQ